MTLLRPNQTQAALEASLQTLKSRSLTQLAMARFLRNRLAVFSCFVLLIILLIAIFAPAFEWFTGYAMDYQDRNFYSAKPPNWEARHYLGTDQNGRDILVRSTFGIRISILVALVAAFVALIWAFHLV